MADATFRGDKALAAKDFQAAVQEYSNAISSNPEAPGYYIKRSTAYSRLFPPSKDLALSDAEIAVLLAQKRNSKELIGQAQFRRGVALYALERFADAEKCFEWTKNPSDTAVSVWQAKVGAKLKDLSASDERGNLSVTETPKIKPSDTIGQDIAATPAEKPTAVNTSDTTNENGHPANPVEAPPRGVHTPASKIRHDWYQSAESVTVTLLAKGVPKDKAVVEIQPNSLAISFPLPTGSDFDLFLEPLFGSIDPEASTYKIMSTKVEFILKKTVPGQKWHSLEGAQTVGGSEDKSADDSAAAIKRVVLAPAAINSAPAYPTSSKLGPKNWDKLASDLTRKPAKLTTDSKDVGEDKDKTADAEADDKSYDSDDDGDAVNVFFKKLYKDADPDTRRAMMKSYQESNGTALSTNWGEVGKRKVETSPPEGMEAKSW